MAAKNSNILSRVCEKASLYANYLSYKSPQSYDSRERYRFMFHHFSFVSWISSRSTGLICPIYEQITKFGSYKEAQSLVQVQEKYFVKYVALGNSVASCKCKKSKPNDSFSKSYGLVKTIKSSELWSSQLWTQFLSNCSMPQLAKLESLTLHNYSDTLS